MSEHLERTYVKSKKGRRFACFPAAILVLLVNDDERLLMMSNSKRTGKWEVVNGAMEQGETVLGAATRELAEEAGSAVRARPLGIVNVESFHYDPRIQFMMSVLYLFRYQGGEISPGDDMAGSEVRWWSFEELGERADELVAPLNQRWIQQRAVELFRLWKHQNAPLQQTLS